MNEGPAATFWGIRGIPNAAETVMVARDILLSQLTGAHVHFCHISCKESISAIRSAKQQGIRVTCETAPHYFTLIDADVKDYEKRTGMRSSRAWPTAPSMPLHPTMPPTAKRKKTWSSTRRPSGSWGLKPLCPCPCTWCTAVC